MRIFWDLGWFFKQHWLRYFLCVICLILVSLVELLPPYLVGQLVDEIQTKTLTSESVWTAVGLIAMIGVAIYALRNGWRILLFGGAIELGRVMRTRLFHHFTQMSPEFYHKHNTGDLMAHATNDVKALESTAAEGVLTLVDSFIAGLAVIGAMIWICGWELTVVALLPFPVMALLMFRYANMLHNRFRIAQESFSALNNRVQEAVSGIRAIRAHNLNADQKQRFSDQSTETVNANMKVTMVDALFDPTISLCVGFSMLGSLGFGAWQIRQELMTLGELTTFTIYLGLLVWPMFAFGWLFNIVERGNASLKRLNDLLKEQPAVQDEFADQHEIPDGDFHIVSKGFRYPAAEKLSLGNLEFTINRGEVLGLCGKTGSGKTTLFRLLMRQYDDENISIKIGDKDHDRMSLDALRSQFALVAQEPFLFSATISENIAFGRSNATQEEIERVAKLACVHDDIIGFPESYKTILGEKGVNLSGGQKQRLTIARAMLLDVDVLLLDDAFCSLDMQTEARIMDNLMNSDRNQTIVLITQRLTNLHRADQIVVLQEGEIAEQGSHDELLASDDWYARIYNRQAMDIAAGKKYSDESLEASV